MPKLEMKSNLAAMKARCTALGEILAMLEPVPVEWLVRGPEDSSGNSLVPIPCDSYKELTNSWRKALLWIDGLDHALAVMLASIISTKSIGDQLWVKIIGPPACGKSTLCEALSVSKQYVYAKSTIRGFYSGHKSKDGKDNSLIPKIRDKTLVIKDGDTLLQSPNLSQILSEARDIYDRVGGTHYRNDISANYSGVNMTMILAGTSSLRSIDSSELGERFLDCVIMEGIDDELEDEILLRAASKADKNMGLEANGQAETQHEKPLSDAMKLTGGYIAYLRENAIYLLQDVVLGEEQKKQCIVLGKFVAFMRARPSKYQEETAERELAARLVGLHIRLGKCLAAVMNKTTLDKEVMRRVTKVALDTCRGQTLKIIKEIYYADRRMASTRDIAVATEFSDSKTRIMLRFLSRIGVVENVFYKEQDHLSSKPYWKMTRPLIKLYRQVVLKGVK